MSEAKCETGGVKLPSKVSPPLDRCPIDPPPPGEGELIPARRDQRLLDFRKRRQRLATRGVRAKCRIARGVEQSRMGLADKS